ncbi:MAG: DsbA family protein [Candidatus Tokpelaia sp.]|nr:MAG: DsbA family protein [Candidatus Tokpelaia sp.]KAA6207216.1 MAG: DsbA family protein [Candidatus Tokpelaia sp.]
MKNSTRGKRIFSFVAAMFVAATVGLWQIVAAQAQHSAPPQVPKPVATVSEAALLRPGELKDMAEGDARAPVTIIEYAALSCGHCADFYLNTMPQLREKYIKTGKVHYILRELAVEPRGTAAAMLTRCVPEDRFFPFVQLLFEKLEEWAFAPDGKTPMMRLAKMAGLDEKEFNACLTNQNLLDQFRKTADLAMKDFDIRVTPTIFINGQKYEGALTVNEISLIIDKALENKK